MREPIQARRSTQQQTQREWSDWPARSNAPGVAGPALDRARSYVGKSNLQGIVRGYPDDCVGYVRHVFGALGVELIDPASYHVTGGVAAIWDTARRRGTLRTSARPGDLVFFTETYDRNRNGQRDDGLTHIGIVERLDEDGGLWFLHRSGHGVERSRVDLNRRTEFHDAHGGLLNDYLRVKDRSGPAMLTGELLYGFASPRP